MMSPLFVSLFLVSFSAVAVSDRLVVEGDMLLSDVLSAPVRASFPDAQLGSGGCRAGFEAILSGEADVALTTRPPNDRELSLARRLGLGLRERVIGFDGLAVIVHPDNRVDGLSLEQLRSVLSGGVVRWMGVGGGDESTRLLMLSPRSGLAAVVRERVLEGADLAETVELVDGAEELVGRVASDLGAVGIVSTSVGRSSVKTLSIDGAIATSEAVSRGTYPLWYPLYLYTLGEPTGTAHQFLSWLLWQDGQTRLLEAGFAPLEATVPLRRTIAEPEPRESRLGVLFRVYFRRGSTFLRTAERAPVLRALARARASSDKVLIVGHAADGESEGLSESRVRFVSQLVSRGGVLPERFELEPVGNPEPIGADTASDRRVDIWLLPRR